MKMMLPNGSPRRFVVTNKFYAQLFELEGDIGARQLVKAHSEHLLSVEVEDPSCVIDIDTRADLKRLSNT